MKNPEDWIFIKELLSLLANTAGTPITVCELDEMGQSKPINTFDEAYYPQHCREIWKLDKGRGKDVCISNMCERVTIGARSIQTSIPRCHAGVSTIRVPIVLDGNIFAIIQFGKFLPNHEAPAEIECRINSHREAMLNLKASPQEDAQILGLLLKDTKHFDEDKIRRLREAAEKAAKIIAEHIQTNDKKQKAQQAANHDVQIRLQAALAHSELLSDEVVQCKSDRGGLTPSVVQAVQDVMGAVEAASLAMHSASRGDYLPDYRFNWHTIDSFVHQAEALCSPEARKKGIKLEIKVDAVRLQCSEEHLQIAINNLLQNAVKYSYRQSTHANHRFVSVRGRAIRGGSELAFSNYGVGILPDELECVFKEGYQSRLAKPEYRTGSGQGLAITKRIIERHHGEIRCTSVSQGTASTDGIQPYLTTFTIWLPLKQPS